MYFKKKKLNIEVATYSVLLENVYDAGTDRLTDTHWLIGELFGMIDCAKNVPTDL